MQDFVLSIWPQTTSFPKGTSKDAVVYYLLRIGTNQDIKGHYSYLIIIGTTGTQRFEGLVLKYELKENNGGRGQIINFVLGIGKDDRKKHS